MFKNNVIIALRIFNRDRMFTAINVLGLACGLAIALLIIQYARFEFSYENMYPKSARILRLTVDYLDGQTLVGQDCETYPPLGPKMKAEMPEVEDYVRVYDRNESTVQIGERSFYLDKLYAADASFFSIFDYPLLYGTLQGIFQEPYQAVLAESTALKYFGKSDVVGETVRMPLSDRTISYKIVGVVPDSPPNTHLKFEMLISYPTLLSDLGETEDNWNGNNTFTYILLSQGTNPQQFASELEVFNEKLYEEEKLENERIISQEIADIHLYSNKPFEPEANGSATSVFFLLGVALLVIVSAYVNYINLATSKALDRAKEVGIRKVVGSSVGQLRHQFLIESALINLFSGGLALLAIFFLHRPFKELGGLPADFQIFDDLMFWQILGSFMILGVLLSGIYPALVLSSFKPVSVLKGRLAGSVQGVLLRKGLVVFQFTITIVLLVQTLAVYQQIDYLRNMDMGLEVDQTIVVKASAQDTIRQNYSVFKDQLLNTSRVQAVSLSETVPGLSRNEMNTTTGIKLADNTEENHYNYYLYRTDHNFIPLMEMELLAGENFPENGSGKFEVIVNEETLRLLGIPSVHEAIGTKLTIFNLEAMIRGVVRNYRLESAKEAHIPILHFYSNGFNDFASVKFAEGDPRENLEAVREIYESNFPNAPFEYFFMDTQFDRQFRAEEQFQAVFTVLTGFAILIACLGLFGLVSFSIAKRTKEIGIRKVIGASLTSIMILLSGDFIKTQLIAVMLGIPITYFLVNSWLENFASRIELSGWLFCIPVFVMAIISLLTMSFKTLKVALANPVDSLRDE